MGAVEPTRRKEPVPCRDCGEPLWFAYEYLCDVCLTIAYLHFRHAMNWPLDEADKKRLGLK